MSSRVFNRESRERTRKEDEESKQKKGRRRLVATGARKNSNRESPILKARLSIILQEFLTTESTKGTKGTKMKISENFVISVPFVVKILSFQRSEEESEPRITLKDAKG